MEIIFRSRFSVRYAISAIALVMALIIQTACQRNSDPQIADPLAAYPWLYLRDSLPVADDEQVVTLIAVGDIQLGRGVKNPAQAFDSVTDWLSHADITLGNLEGTLAPVHQELIREEDNPAAPILLSADPEAATWLSQAGFDILSLANNHARDAGTPGLASTIELLQQNGVQVIGVQQRINHQAEPLVIEKRGLRLAFLAVNAIPTPSEQSDSGKEPTIAQPPAGDLLQWDKESIPALVQAAQAQADIVIVSIHWGYEYQTRVDAAQKWIAESLLQSGADIVLGHHPHVIQAHQVATPGAEPDRSGASRSQLVAYSLGNFIFDQGQGETGKGQALRLFFDQDGLRAAQSLTVTSGAQPQLLDPAIAGQADLEPTNLPVQVDAYVCDQRDCTPITLPGGVARDTALNGSGIFTSGKVDLTGDGRDETVTLEGGRITILEEDMTSWESPPEWKVVDLAPGDLDQDGRQDILAAFWKPDEEGALRSHPFLIREQGGRYQEVWGGSAVSDPILEVEAGDLDGDGWDELVVLEQNPKSSSQSVTVWRWHGWGFSLDWRSPEGAYENLQIIDLNGKRVLTVCTRHD